MSRRKGEITGHMNERNFPHVVELALPPGGFRSRSSEFEAFHRGRHGPATSVRGRGKTMPARLSAETRLRAWGERTRTRKCRSEKISLKHPMNPLAFQNILGREIFRGGAANDLTCGSGAKTGQFEIDCPPGRALTTGVLARMVALFPPASPWWHGLPRLSKSATACSLCAGLCAQRERVCGYEHRA